MELPRAILLDLDDTILDSYSDPDEAWLELCHEFADRLRRVTPTTLHAAVVSSRDWFWKHTERARQGRLDLTRARRDIVSGAFVRLGIRDSPVVNEMADRYTIIREQALKPFPAAFDTLQRLKDMGTSLALITNGGADMQRSKIERFALEKYFDHVQIEGEFGIGKPDERAFRNALDVLGFGPSQAWMVGDDLEADIQGAQQVGIHAIWVDSAGRGIPHEESIRPDRIIGTLSDLVN